MFLQACFSELAIQTIITGRVGGTISLPKLFAAWAAGVLVIVMMGDICTLH